MANPWERYGGQPAPQRPPSVIYGDPKPVDPMEAERLRLAQIASSQSAEAASIKADRDRLALTTEKRTAAITGGVDTTGDERTAAFLASRINSEIARLGDISGGMQSKPSVGPKVAGAVLGQDVRNSMTDNTRQRVEAAQVNILDAALTLGTGAAYSPAQLAGYQQSYFPQIGDGADLIKDKQQRLVELLESAKLKAGASAPLIDEALAKARAAMGARSEPVSEEEAKTQLEQQLASGASVGSIVKWLTDNGRPPTPDDIDRIAANVGNRNPDVRQKDNPLEGVGRGLASGLGDVVEGVGDVVGLVANPLNAGLNATGLPQAITGSPLSADLGQHLRDGFGFPSPRTDGERLISTIGKTAIGGLTFAGAGRGASNIASGTMKAATTRLGATPIADSAAGAGAGGASEFTRQRGGGPVAQIAAGLAGGAGGLVGGNALSRVVNRPTAVQPNALMQAGQAEGVTVRRAMIDPDAQARTTGVDATVFGSPIVRRGMNATGDQIEAGVKRLGRDGTALDENVAGQSIQGSVERMIKKSGKQARRQYDAAEAAAGDARINPQEAGVEVGGIITRLSETANTNSAEIAYLKGLEEDIGKGLSVGALRDLRTTLRQKISKGELTFGQNEARVLGVMDAISRDLTTGLQEQGKGAAARLFAQADRDYSQRMDFITNTAQKIVGKRNSNLSPERVFQNFKAMATPKGDEAGMARMMKIMEPDEQADMAATFAETLGKNRKGEFSTAFLATQAQALPKAARVNIFGQDGAESLERLSLLAKEHSRVMGGLNNSRTGVANDYRSWLSNLVFGGGGTAALSAVSGGGAGASAGLGLAATVAGAGVKVGRDVLTARAMVSPDVTKWLASAPKTASPGAINAHFARLGVIASRNPSLAQDIGIIQQRMLDVANDMPGQVAASPAPAPADNVQDRRP